MKKKILAVISIIIVILSIVFLTVVLLYQPENIESSLQILSATIIISVFLFGAISYLFRKD